MCKITILKNYQNIIKRQKMANIKAIKFILLEGGKKRNG